MNVVMIGNEACFPKWYLRCNVPEDFPFSYDETGIYIYKEKELEKVKAWLNKLDIAFTEEQLAEPPDAEKARGIKYNSKTEILDHLLKNKPPASLQLADILSRVENAEKKAMALETQLTTFTVEKQLI